MLNIYSVEQSGPYPMHIHQYLDRNFAKPSEDAYSIFIAFTGHDASITIAKGSEILEVIEMERFLNLKNVDFTYRKWKDGYSGKILNYSLNNVKTFFYEVSSYISRKYTSVFDIGFCVDRKAVLVNKENDAIIDYTDYFYVKNDNWHLQSHHVSHACSAFFQSKFEKALVITIDGGSPDGTTNFFFMDKNGTIKYISNYNSLLCKVYPKFGNIFGDIKPISYNYSLIHPGKVMGLAGYGTPRENFVEVFKRLMLGWYDESKKDDVFSKLGLISEIHSPAIQPNPKILDKIDRIYEKKQFDLAASLQKAFEDLYLELIGKYLDEYPDIPICISGGGALNINANTLVKERYNREVFIPPDPSDCGLSLGCALAYIKPVIPYENPYSGPYLLDRDLLSTYVNEEFGISDKDSNFIVIPDIDNNISALVDLINSDKIIGIARGRCERGPRALGNRSIICSVLNPEMKNIVNSKVKHREWFRPFSPIVRLESVSKYFHWEGESRFMTFCPKVRSEYIKEIPSVVHVDGTARVQTITKDQNKFIYTLLTEISKSNGGYDLLLNTSFNVDGKPIISSIKDAIKVLKETELDGIVIENVLIYKKITNI